MLSLSELAQGARRALELVRAEPDVREAEAFVSASAHLLARLSYTSHIPCNGVEEPKSTDGHGLGLQVVFEHRDGVRVGFGSEARDLGPDGIRRALARARLAAVPDPHFVSLPRSTGEPRVPDAQCDPALMGLSDARLVEVGWTVVRGALQAFLTAPQLAEIARSEEDLAALGLILGGDVSIQQERVAVASSALGDVQTDESARLTAAATAMVEARRAKGSACSQSARLDDFTDEAGVDAVLSAVGALDGVRIPTGSYTVVFGPQPIADLVGNLLLPACRAGAFYAGTTPFLGRLGRQVASPELSVRDDGGRAGLAASRGITGDGLPTGRTDLIRDGVLVGLLSSWYESQKLLRDPHVAAKLGATGPAVGRALVPRNGFRAGAVDGRSFDRRPGTVATNVILEGRAPESLDDLIRRVGRGLYVGRIWYTYPINGLRAGDFTCTVVADSYAIRDGRRAEPIRPNTLRINDNIARVLGHVVGMTGNPRGIAEWAADEVVYAPEIAVSDVRVDAIAGFTEDLP